MKSIFALLATLVWMGGCHRQPRMATLPPAQTAAAPAKDVLATLPEPPSPQEGVSTPSAAPLAIGSGPQPLPPPATPSKRVRRTRSAAASIAPVIQPATDPVPQPDPPMLGQMLNAQEHASYKQKIDDELKNARRHLAAVSGKNLDEAQRAAAREIQMFIARAEELRKSDLVAAEGLSRKADLLARDLFARVAR